MAGYIDVPGTTFPESKTLGFNLNILFIFFSDFGKRQFATGKTSVDYNFLSKEQLAYLDSLGIKVFSETPFAFPYFSTLRPILDKNIDDKFFDRIIDIFINELSICFYRSIFEQEFFKKAQEREKWLGDQMNDIANLMTSVKGEKFDASSIGENGLFLNPEMLKAKWTMDNCILRIRSQWDRLLNILAIDFFDVNCDSKSLGEDKESGRIGQLIRQVTQKNLIKNDIQQSFFDCFIDMLLTIKDLRNYRDVETHLKSKRVLGALHNDYEQLKIENIWPKYSEEEHNKIREGIICFLGIISSDKAIKI